VGFSASGQFFWCTLRNNRPAPFSPFGTKIDHPVRTFDHIEVVLDDEHGCPTFDQPVERLQQFADVVKVQASGRFVEDEQRHALGLTGKVGRELDPLGLASRQGSRRLSQAQVTEADIPNHLELSDERRLGRKEGDRLLHGHVEDVVDILPSGGDLEDLLLETRPLAFFADQFDVGEKLHLDRDCSGTLADFAAPTWEVEREMGRGKVSGMGLSERCEELSDVVEGLDIGDGIGARRAANRGLIDENDFADLAQAFNPIEFSDWTLPVTVEFLGAGVEDVCLLYTSDAADDSV